MKYLDAKKYVQQKEASLCESRDFFVVSNITLPTLDIYLRKLGVDLGVFANVETVNFAEALSVINCGSLKCYDYVIMIVHPDFDFSGLRYDVLNSDFDFIDKAESMHSYYLQIFNSLKARKRKIIVGPYSQLFMSLDYKIEPYNSLCRYLSLKFERSVTDVEEVFFDADSLCLGLSHDEVLSWRDYYSKQALYSNKIISKLGDSLVNILKGDEGQVKKVLCLDCDNTLWSGVIGEDGVDGIGLTQNEGRWDVFYEIHRMVKWLQNRGVLVALVTKNEPDDVEEVLTNHPNIGFDVDQIVSIKAGWGDKVASLLQISEELNLGLSSFIFVDDSSVECAAVRQTLTDVEVVQVPKDLSLYPIAFRKVLCKYFKLKLLEDDKDKANKYITERKRRDISLGLDKKSFIDSLELRVKVHLNDNKQVDRFYQLAQKTNQFNFTTIRYGKSEIDHMISDKAYDAFTFEVNDKFGAYGVVGLAVIKNNGGSVALESFLLSCRALGRDVEYAIIKFLCCYYSEKEIRTFSGSYIRSQKNKQIESFLSSLGVNECVGLEEGMKIDFQLFDTHFKRNNANILVEWS